MNNSLVIATDDPRRADVVRFLEQHLSDMGAVSPPQSNHALDTAALDQPGITFWSVRGDGLLAGCGALKELTRDHAEIKSMRTSARFRRRGVASRLLEHIILESRARGYSRLSLETGSMAFFEPARRLYRGFGFTFCEPFGDYVEDPNSVFMTLEL